MTIGEAAAVLRISRTGLRRLIRSRQIAAVEIGRRVLVEAVVIERYVRAHTRPALADLPMRAGRRGA